MDAKRMRIDTADVTPDLADAAAKYEAERAKARRRAERFGIPAEKTVDPDPFKVDGINATEAKRLLNHRDPGVITGFDVTSAEEEQRRVARAARFGLAPEKAATFARAAAHAAGLTDEEIKIREAQRQRAQRFGDVAESDKLIAQAAVDALGTGYWTAGYGPLTDAANAVLVAAATGASGAAGSAVDADASGTSAAGSVIVDDSDMTAAAAVVVADPAAAAPAAAAVPLPPAPPAPRPNVLHLRTFGYFPASTMDVKAFFGADLRPSHIEWLNGRSCNAIFGDEYTAKRALAKLSEPIPTSPGVPAVHAAWRVCLKTLVKRKTDIYAAAGTRVTVYVRPATVYDVKEWAEKERTPGPKSMGTYSVAGAYSIVGGDASGSSGGSGSGGRRVVKLGAAGKRMDEDDDDAASASGGGGDGAAAGSSGADAGAATAEAAAAATAAAAAEAIVLRPKPTAYAVESGLAVVTAKVTEQLKSAAAHLSGPIQNPAVAAAARAAAAAAAAAEASGGRASGPRGVRIVTMMGAASGSGSSLASSDGGLSSGGRSSKAVSGHKRSRPIAPLRLGSDDDDDDDDDGSSSGDEAGRLAGDHDDADADVDAGGAGGAVSGARSRRGVAASTGSGSSSGSNRRAGIGSRTHSISSPGSGGVDGGGAAAGPHSPLNAPARDRRASVGSAGTASGAASAVAAGAGGGDGGDGAFRVRGRGGSRRGGADSGGGSSSGGVESFALGAAVAASGGGRPDDDGMDASAGRSEAGDDASGGGAYADDGGGAVGFAVTRPAAAAGTGKPGTGRDVAASLRGVLDDDVIGLLTSGAPPVTDDSADAGTA